MSDDVPHPAQPVLPQQSTAAKAAPCSCNLKMARKMAPCSSDLGNHVFLRKPFVKIMFNFGGVFDQLFVYFAQRLRASSLQSPRLKGKMKWRDSEL